MIDTHNKLVSGEKVDHVAVSELLLGGLINKLFERIINVEHENHTNKLRLQTLENWIRKIDEQIKEVSKKTKKPMQYESLEIKTIEKKISRLQKNVDALLEKHDEIVTFLKQTSNVISVFPKVPLCNCMHSNS